MAPGQREDGASRREVIIEAALMDIRELGLHRTTHRTIAARAGVPLGSLTYYFSGLDNIFESAFSSMATRLAGNYRKALASASTRQEAEDAVVDLICGTGYMDDLSMRALFEMYSYSGTNAAVAQICRDWVLASRASLGLHFAPATCRALDALVEGWPVHRLFEGEPLDRALVSTAVHAVATAAEGFQPPP